MLSRSPPEDCLSNGSNDQTKYGLVVQHIQLSTSLLSPPFSYTVVKHGPCLLTLKKRIQVFETKRTSKILCFSYLEHKTNDWCGARSTSLWVHRNLFWQSSRDGNLYGSGMSHATTASPKPSFRAPWRVGYAVVGRGNAGWTTSKSGHPCPCQSCSQEPPAEKTGRGSLLNRPSCPPDDSIGQGTELN